MAEQEKIERLPGLTEQLCDHEREQLVTGCEVELPKGLKDCPVTQCRIETRADLVQLVTSCALCERRRNKDTDPTNV